MAKPKKCKFCKGVNPYSGPYCKYECALAQLGKDRESLQKVKEKIARKVYRAEKLRLKSRREWLKDAQTVVNQYVRLRDDALPCISCGRHHNGQYHAGHYLSVGARPELRFETLQIHKQCAPCNNHLSGNIALYRINLIKKIGIDKVEWLEGYHLPKKYNIEELQGIIAEYKEKIKEIKKGRG